jgi:signal peptidase I
MAARMAERVLAAFGAAMLLYLLCFDLSVVTSGSMAPTLKGSGLDDGDRVLTERVTYWFRSPRRWEVATIGKADGVQVMKRVVGLPGERVKLTRDGVLCVNDQPIERPAALQRVRYFGYGNLAREKFFDCGAGYYVLGDDSKDSEDSRYEGVVEPKRVVGRAWLVLWPPARMGRVGP